MRTLERNKQQFWYATFQGKAEIIKDGLHTGEYAAAYSPWKPCFGNISPARGYSSAELFGNDISYDRVIVLEGINLEIDENTVLAIDMEPNERSSATVMPVYDYVVTRKAQSLNFTSYAVAKVKVKANDQI